MGCPSSASPEILAFGNHCSVIFQPILNCFVPNFKLKYEDSEDIKTDSVNRVVLNLHQIKRRAFFLGHALDLGLGLNPSGEEEIDLHQVLVLTLVQNMMTIKKVRSENVPVATSLVMWSVILHLSLKGQSRRQSPKTNPCQSTRRTNTRKRDQKLRNSQSTTYYTGLLKIDKNENRDVVLFENHGRETTTILKFSARNFEVLAF